MLDEVSNLVVLLPKMRIQDFSEVEAKLHIGHALSVSKNFVHKAHRDRRGAVMGLHHTFSLGGCGERQEDIAGCLSGWRHERVESYNKLHCVVDSLHPSLWFC